MRVFRLRRSGRFWSLEILQADIAVAKAIQNPLLKIRQSEDFTYSAGSHFFKPVLPLRLHKGEIPETRMRSFLPKILGWTWQSY